MTDAVNHPPHYAVVPGVECIDVVEHFPFCRGNAIKYLWRAGAKGDLVEDLRKAIWYIEREIAAQLKTELCCQHPDASHDSDGSCMEDTSTTRGYAEMCHGARP